MFVALTVIVKLPDVPAGRKTDSTLFLGSAAPPVVELAPEKTLPRKVWPLIVTWRSRLLTAGEPVVGPGASVHASVTRNGWEVVATEPVTWKVCPVAPKVCVWSMIKRCVPSNARPMSILPIPWLFDGRLPPAPVPVIYAAEFIRNAFVIAGEGAPKP